AIAAEVGSRNHVQCLQRWKKVGLIQDTRLCCGSDVPVLYYCCGVERIVAAMCFYSPVFRQVSGFDGGRTHLWLHIRVHILTARALIRVFKLTECVLLLAA
ncbi:unnamed protein product, partial [Sphacelaria rigidula]